MNAAKWLATTACEFRWGGQAALCDRVFPSLHLLTLVYRKHSNSFLMEKTCCDERSLDKYFIETSARPCSLLITVQLSGKNRGEKDGDISQFL